MATRRVFRHVVVVVLFKTTKPEKKSAKKNTQTDDDEKDEKDETTNFFCHFFISMAYERDVDFLMLFLVFGFLRCTYS